LDQVPIQKEHRGAGGAAQVVNICVLDSKVRDHLSDHPLNFPVKRHRPFEHVIETEATFSPKWKSTMLSCFALKTSSLAWIRRWNENIAPR
jgi:hypothetical protein